MKWNNAFNRLAGLGAIALLILPSLPRAADLSASEILAAADRARGGGMPGVVWRLKITSNGADFDAEDVQELTVKVMQDNSIAAVTYPPRRIGSKLLQVSRNMWFGRPDLRKPVSISQRQKMTGQAANGDIASTNYVSDYRPTLVRQEQVNGEDAYVLDLVAKEKWVTYDRILYWVSKPRLVALKAEYYTVSGKLFKAANFEYGNSVNFDGRRQAFISKATIRDAIDKDNYSILEYSNVKVRELSPSEFTVTALSE